MIWEYTADGKIWQFHDNKQSSTALFICEEIIQRDVYQLNSIELSPDDEVLDVGGNIGVFANVVQNRFKCLVHSFEPTQESWEWSRLNRTLNGAQADKIRCHNVAVSKTGIDRITLGYLPHAPGNSGKHEKGGISQTVAASSLLAWISEKTKFIKIDCEGEEYEILPEILPAIGHVPYLAIEAHPVPGDPGARDQLRRLVEDQYAGKLIWLQA